MPWRPPSSLRRVRIVAGESALAVDRHRVALLEADLDHLRRVGRVLGIDGALVDVGRRLLGGVLQHLALGRGVQQVRVDRERRLAALVPGDRDLVLLGEVDEPGARGQVPEPPGRDHLDVGVERVGGELEPDLVVALAGRAMRHRVGAGLGGDLDQPLGDQRAGDRGAEQVEAFVERVGAEHREHEVADEFLAQVLDVDRAGAHHLGLGAGRFEFLALAQVGGEGHHLAAVFGLQPFQDDRGVEAAGIGEDDFLRSRHARVPRVAGSGRRL